MYRERGCVLMKPGFSARRRSHPTASRQARATAMALPRDRVEPTIRDADGATETLVAREVIAAVPSRLL